MARSDEITVTEHVLGALLCTGYVLVVVPIDIVSGALSTLMISLTPPQH